MANPDLKPRFLHPFTYWPFYLSACLPCFLPRSLPPSHCVPYPSNIYYVHASTHLCIYQFFLCHQGPHHLLFLNYSGSQHHGGWGGNALFQTEPPSPQFLTCRWIETLSFYSRTSLKVFRTFWEGVWTERVVLFRFWHLVWFVVGSKKSRQVRKGPRGNASEIPHHMVSRLPNRYRRRRVRIEGMAQGRETLNG